MKELNVTVLRADFPILKQTINGKPLIYLDNAATTQKPQRVLDAILNYYSRDNANVHRGVHTLSARADRAYAEAREKVRRFINAKHVEEIVFVRGTTEAINLVAYSFGQTYCQAGDEILLSNMEHHSNIVPWQILGDRIGSKISVVAIDDRGELRLDEYARLLQRQPKLVALTHVSNVLGTLNPIKEIVTMAHAKGIPVLVDGAQAIAHLPVDVQDLDCDFYAFSGHKMYAPTGIGVLYGKKHFLEKMPPCHGGGGMIKIVDFAKTEYADSPQKFEAGTPNIGGAIGLAAAIDYLQAISMPLVENHDRSLMDYAVSVLSEISGLKFIGMAKNKVGVISFLLDNIHAHDVGTIIDADGIAIRAGHHCAMPLLRHYGLSATARVSLGIYNTKDEIDALGENLKNVKRIFANE